MIAGGTTVPGPRPAHKPSRRTRRVLRAPDRTYGSSIPISRSALQEVSMHLTVAEPELVPVALAAIKAVATAREELHPTQRSMLSLAQKLILETEADLDALAPVGPEELARKVRGRP